MFKSTSSYIGAVLLALLITVSGCKSKFEKLKASNDNAKKYQEAVKYYNKKDYNRALSLFEDLVQRYRGRGEAEDLYWYYAYTNYNLRDYTSARYHFKTFADTYPSSPRAEECRYMAAYCYYLESPVYSLDQENTLKAIDALQLFINLYPKSEKVVEASKLIDILRGKLEEKSYANAKLYLTIGDYKSAVIAFNNSMRDYPDSKFSEEMEFLIIKAEYLYAKNSLEVRQEERYNEAIKSYEEFSEKYPQSKYFKEASELKKDSEKGIENAKRYLADVANNQKILRQKSENQENNNETEVQTLNNNNNEQQ
jgi:outer membrane protein assembly factor BamD